MEPAEVENPVGKESAGPQQPAFDLENLFTGVMEKTTTPKEAASVLDGRFAEMETRMAEMGARTATPGQPSETAIKSVVARLSETPTNWHQGTVYFLSSNAPEDATMKKYVPWMFLFSVIIVFAQCATAAGILTSIFWPACIFSDQCITGMYCEIGMRNRCRYCGNSAPLPMENAIDAETGQAVTYNQAEDLEYAGFNLTAVADLCSSAAVGVNQEAKLILMKLDTFDRSVESVIEWCDRCVRPLGDVDDLSSKHHAAGSVAAMGRFDWMAVWFTGGIVALTVVGELK